MDYMDAAPPPYSAASIIEQGQFRVVIRKGEKVITTLNAAPPPLPHEHPLVRGTWYPRVGVWTNGTVSAVGPVVCDCGFQYEDSLWARHNIYEAAADAVRDIAEKILKKRRRERT